MTEDDAKMMISIALRASRILERGVRDLRDRQSDVESKAYRLAIGTVLTTIGEELIEPVFARFPDMEPEATEEGWRKFRTDLARSYPED